MRHFHRHKTLRATHRNGGFGLMGQSLFDSGDASHFQLVGGELAHAGFFNSVIKKLIKVCF